MKNTDDPDLQIKKRARRRLVGAVVFVAFAALVLPMVMDQEPVPPAQEVEIQIPGRDASPFRPDLTAQAPLSAEETVAPQTETPAPTPTTPVVSQESPPTVSVVRTTPGQQQEQTQTPARPEPEKPQVKPEKPQPEPESSAANARASNEEARRAAAILAGNMPDAPPAATSGQHVILIGAFSNEANVKNLKTKLGELKIPVYTEPLDSPQGKKTRVRAGPFPDRGTAEKALEKIKRIGVSGVVVAK